MFPDYFAKMLSDFRQMNQRSGLFTQEILQKGSQLLRNQPAVQYFMFKKIWKENFKISPPFASWTKREPGSVWPRRLQFLPIRSVERMVQIMHFPIILQRSSRTLEKSTRDPAFSLKMFCKKALNFFRNQPAVQQSSSEKIAKKPLSFHKINPPSWSSLKNFLEKPSDFN